MLFLFVKSFFLSIKTFLNSNFKKFNVFFKIQGISGTSFHLFINYRFENGTYFVIDIILTKTGQR